MTEPLRREIKAIPMWLYLVGLVLFGAGFIAVYIAIIAAIGFGGAWILEHDSLTIIVGLIAAAWAVSLVGLMVVNTVRWIRGRPLY